MLPPRGWWGRTSRVTVLHPFSSLSSPRPGQELRKWVHEGCKVSIIFKIAFTITSDQLQLKTENKISADNIYTLAPSSFKTDQKMPVLGSEPWGSLWAWECHPVSLTRPAGPHVPTGLTFHLWSLASSVLGSQTSFCCFWPGQPFLPQGLWTCCILHLTLPWPHIWVLLQMPTFPLPVPASFHQHLCISLSEKLFPTSQARLDSLSSYFIRMSQCRIIQFSSVAQSCPTLCDPMDCSTPGLPVLHHLPEFTQTHVHWDCVAIQPSHPLSSPSPPTFNLSQHQDLFKWVSSSHQMAKVLEFQLQHQSFQWIFRTDFL